MGDDCNPARGEEFNLGQRGVLMTKVVAQALPRVVAGVDGSPDSVLALRWAAYATAMLRARLSAVMAWEYPPSFGWAAIAPGWDPAEDAANVLAKTAEAAFGDQRPAGLELLVREGGPAKVLLQESQGASMLVVGSRGHGGFVGLLLGSVSANVAEHASCPVLIIHGNQGPPPALSED
jgi:nucleotide-binding universal stress UspA family protein